MANWGYGCETVSSGVAGVKGGGCAGERCHPLGRHLSNGQQNEYFKFKKSAVFCDQQKKPII
jgi:hypothetical protein